MSPRQTAVYLTGGLLGRPARRKRTRAEIATAIRFARAAGAVPGPRWADTLVGHFDPVRIRGVLGWGRVELLDVKLPECPEATRRIETRWAGVLRRGARVEAGVVRVNSRKGGFVLQPCRVLRYTPLGADRDSATILCMDLSVAAGSAAARRRKA